MAQLLTQAVRSRSNIWGSRNLRLNR